MIRRSALAMVVLAVAAAGFVSGGAERAGALVNSKTVLVSTPHNQVVGYPVMLKATVRSLVAPTGTVEFFDGATSLGTAPVVMRIAKLSATLDRGTHTMTATYSGDGNVAPSTSAVWTIIVGDPSTVNVDLLYKSVPLMPQSSWTATTPIVFYAQIVVKFDQINYGARTGTATVTIDGVNHNVTVKMNRIIYKAASGVGLGDHTASATYHGDIHYLPDTSITRHFTISNP